MSGLGVTFEEQVASASDLLFSDEKQRREQLATGLEVMAGSALMRRDHAAWKILVTAATRMRAIQPGDNARIITLS